MKFLKYTKYTISICLIAILISSCSKDDDDSGETLQILLSKIVMNSQTFTYTYDDDNRLISYYVDFANPTNNYTASYTYNSSGLDPNGNTTSQLAYDEGGTVTVTTENSDFDDKYTSNRSLPRTSFVKNVNNYRTVTITIEGGSPDVGTYTYEYNSDSYPNKRTANTGNIATYEYIKR